MNTLILFICLLAAAKHVAEMSLRRNLFVRLVHAALIIAFMIWAHPYCLEISKGVVDKYVVSQDGMNLLMVLVIVDLMAALLLARSRSFVGVGDSQWSQRGFFTILAVWLQRILFFLPPMLIFPAAFYIRMELLYVFPGVSFVAVTVIFAMLLTLMTIFAPWIARYVYQSTSFHVALSLIIVALVMLGTAIVQNSGAGAQGAGLNISAIEDYLLVGGGVLLLGSIGYVLNMFRSRMLRNKL